MIGLLALMLLHDARRAARTTPDGELVLLDDQDRRLWNRAQMQDGAALVERAVSSHRVGPYALQAAIAAVHTEATRAADTDWRQIVGLYDVLARIEPSPVIELNRAAAIAMLDGPDAGLRLIDAILDRGDLTDYHFAYSAKGELCRRLGRHDEARAAYTRALALVRQAPERRFLKKRLAELQDRRISRIVNPEIAQSSLTPIKRSRILHSFLSNVTSSQDAGSSSDSRCVNTVAFGSA